MLTTRRDALRSLAAIAATTGVTLQPITSVDARGVALVVIKSRSMLSLAARAHLTTTWREAVAGTPLAGVKVVLLDPDLELEIVRDA